MEVRTIHNNNKSNNSSIRLMIWILLMMMFKSQIIHRVAIENPSFQTRLKRYQRMLDKH